MKPDLPPHAPPCADEQATLERDVALLMVLVDCSNFLHAMNIHRTKMDQASAGMEINDFLIHMIAHFGDGTTLYADTVALASRLGITLTRPQNGLVH